MDQERWKTIEDIYHGAIDLDGDVRASFLNISTGGDDRLRDEVESLLAATNNDLPFTTDTGFSLGMTVLADQELQDLTGKVLRQYRLLQLIGRGGMGEVYRALDFQNERTVAVKLLPTHITDESRIQRFRHEARLAAAISHENVAKVFEIGEENGMFFIAMEFVEGETLRERLHTQTLTFGDAIEIATRVALALAAAQAVGVVHRDIKPENIIIGRNGRVKVVDFGLAKLTEPASTGNPERTQPRRRFSSIHTEPGLLIGTANYMSPEQARGQEVDRRTDIWSWGVVFYEMLAGEAPFSGPTNSDIIASILTDQAVIDRSCFPESIRTILAKCIHKDKAIRYAHAADLVADLRQLRADNEGGELFDRSVPLDGFVGLDLGSGGVIGQPSGWGRRLMAGLLAIAIVVLGGFLGYRSMHAATVRPIESIAVMPFVNETGNTDVDYISDGMTDSLIKSLSHLPNLSVKAQSTVFTYKGKQTSSEKVGEELNVQAILLGSVAPRGNQISLNLQLVNTQTQDVIWTEQYDRSRSELILLQTEIARDVSKKLEIRLTGADRQSLEKRYTNDLVAYTDYLQGRFYWNKRTGEDLKKSVEYYEAAIDLDPKFALAYAGLADSYMLLPTFGGAGLPESISKAEAAATKALDLDESLAEAHTTLSFAYFNCDWKFDESEEHLRRSIALNPNYSTAYHWYGNANLLAMRRFDESIDELKKARELDPLSPAISTDLGSSYLYALRIDEAIAQYNKTLEMDNNFYFAHLNLGRAYLLKEEYQLALYELQRAGEIQTDPRIPMLRSRIYSKMGRRADALQMLDELREMRRNKYISNFNFAVVYDGLGKTDLAFASLEDAFKAHDANLIYLKADPLLADLHGDPRFAALLDRMGMPQ